MGLLLDSWLNILFVAVFAATIFIIDWINQKLKYFDENYIFHEKFQLLSLFKAVKSGQNVEEGYIEMYNNYPKSPYIGYYSFLRPTFLLRNPDLINKITKTNFTNFHDRWINEPNENVDPFSATLVTLKGEKWKEVRCKLSPAFSSSKLQWMFPVMQGCANSLAQQLRKTWKSADQDVDAKRLFSSYTFSTLATCGFGIEPESIKNPDCEFRKMLKVQMDRSPIMMIKLLFKLTVPFVTHFIRITTKEVENFFVGIMRNEFQRRRSQNVKRPDFVQLIMEIKEKGQVQSDGKETEDYQLQSHSRTIDWTDAFLTSQVMTLFEAGYDSSSQAISITAYYLSKNIDIQDKVRQSLKATKQRYGTLNYQSLKELTLLDNCISESLRLFPPAGLILRICTEDFPMDDGVIIRKGQSAVIAVRAIHTDEKYWSNPNKFDPERFSRDNILPGTYLPFGIGPRTCIGQKFAMLQAKLVLAKIIENFYLLQSTKTEEPLKRSKWFDQNVQGGTWIRLQPIDLSTT